MENKSIQTIKTMFKNNELNNDNIQFLRMDERKGVQQIVKQYDKQVAEKAAQLALFNEKKQFERRFVQHAHDYLAGVDEAGRGPLAGPVVAAAVILPETFKLTGLTDSKQLTETERNTYYDIIKQEAISYYIAVIDHQKIDHINILNATKMAMTEALTNLDPAPHVALIDAVTLHRLPFPTKEVIKGDDKSIAIAAASVLAKVKRDKIMDEIAIQYPEYGFDTHKGYGTKQHMEALEQYGPSPYHRLSFTPVKNSVK